MCFSAEADLIAGVVVGGIGVDAVRHTTDRRLLPLAALPVLFGVHQVIEAVVWWGSEGRTPACAAEAATSVYLAIAYALPLVVPFMVLAGERDPGSRRWITGCAVLGGVVSAVLLADLLDGPVTVRAGSWYLAYDAGIDGGGVLAVLYVAATCLPMVRSSAPRLRLFGWLNLAAVAVLGSMLAAGFVSLWCAWAAVWSGVIRGEVRRSRAPDGDPDPAVARATSSPRRDA